MEGPMEGPLASPGLEGPTAAQWSAAKLGVLGVLFVISPEAGGSTQAYEYVYGPIFTDVAECRVYARRGPELADGAVLVETCIWWVEDWYTTTVLRNRRWWAEKGQPAYEAFWRDVDNARTTGQFEAAHGFVAPVAEEMLEPLPSPPSLPSLPSLPSGTVEATHGFIIE